MITALLLLPVLATLGWLYWYLLPQRRWLLADSLVLVAVIVLTGTYIWWVQQQDFSGAGPLWPQIVSVVGAYAILIIGLSAALLWRRRRS